MKDFILASDMATANFVEQHVLFSPEGRQAAWRIEVSLRGDCPRCKQRGHLKHDHGRWTCWNCVFEFSEEQFLKFFPSPFAGKEPETNEVYDKADTL